jgi:AcrR family transcriptional regulator
MQARSTATVEAIFEATTQVLLDVGKERLTTEKVALRAGVSIGTLYQYFPNKSALLQAVLGRHLEELARVVERTCELQRGRPLQEMATALVQAFLEAKRKDARTGAALYAVSSDIDGITITKQIGARSVSMISRLLASTSDSLTKEPEIIADVLQSAMLGVGRRLVESAWPETYYESLRQELILMVCAYLKTCSA